MKQVINNKIIFSVIIPAYNRRQLLKEAIKSITQQNYSNYEIIIIDNGSTDGTRLDFNRKENVCKYFYLSIPGVSRARNYGIAKARGKYIVFLDSDDKLSNNYFNDMLNYINMQNIKTPYFSITPLIVFYKELDLKRSYVFNPYNLYLEKKLFSLGSGSLVTLKSFRDKKIFYDEKLEIYEDVDLSIQFQKAGIKNYFLDKIGLFCKIPIFDSNKHLSISHDGIKYKNHEIFFIKNKEFLKFDNIQYSKQIFSLAIDACLAGFSRIGRKHLLESWRLNKEPLCLVVYCLSFMGVDIFKWVYNNVQKLRNYKLILSN